MNFDQLRALAGIPMTRTADGRKVINEIKFAAVKSDGHFDIVASEANVGKLAVILAKEGLPVDITYDGMENFYFNFKSSELKNKAEKLVKSNVREAASPAYQAAYAEVAGGKGNMDGNSSEEDVYSDEEVREIAKKHGLTPEETQRLIDASKDAMGSP